MNHDFDRDAEVLAKRLQEYTSSLQVVLQDRIKMDSQVLWWIGGGGILVTAFLPILWHQIGGIQTSGLAAIGVATAVTAVFVLSTILKLRASLNEEIDVLAQKLDKIARRASQQMEHARPSFGIELELDLRLTEAEAALRKAERFVPMSRSRAAGEMQPDPIKPWP
jgi:hypothetical protein